MYLGPFQPMFNKYLRCQVIVTMAYINVAMVTGQYPGKCFTPNPGLQERTCVSNHVVFTATNARSLLECSVLCIQSQFCASMFYSDVIKTCVGCRGQYVTDTNLGTMEGSVYFTRDLDGGYGYVGCYGDCYVPHVPCVRAMSMANEWSSTQQSVARCSNFCKGHSTMYFGLELRYECYCDDVYDAGGPVNRCESTCIGNTMDSCGGHSALSVYMFTFKC